MLLSTIYMHAILCIRCVMNVTNLHRAEPISNSIYLVAVEATITRNCCLELTHFAFRAVVLITFLTEMNSTTSLIISDDLFFVRFMLDYNE